MPTVTELMIVFFVSFIGPPILFFGSVIVVGGTTMSKFIYMADWAAAWLDIGGYHSGFPILCTVVWTANGLLTLCMIRLLTGTGDKKATATQAAKMR
jgi:hypothetical protein